MVKVRNLKTGRKSFTLNDGDILILNSYEEKEIKNSNITPNILNAVGIGDVSITELGEDPVVVKHKNKKSGGEE